MLDFQKRVIDEATALYENMVKLAAFLDSSGYEKLDIANRYLLRCQLKAMQTYYEILQGRIALFEPCY